MGCLRQGRLAPAGRGSRPERGAGRQPLKDTRTPLRFASGAGRQARGALEEHQDPGKSIRHGPR